MTRQLRPVKPRGFRMAFRFGAFVIYECGRCKSLCVDWGGHDDWHRRSVQAHGGDSED